MTLTDADPASVTALSSDDLARLDGLDKAATTGPWMVKGPMVWCSTGEAVANVAEWGHPAAEAAVAELIAEFRNRTPDLVAELREARAALTFDALRYANRTRVVRWHPPETVPWTGADWSNAMQGEAGEAGNVVKKLRRIETGTTGHKPELDRDGLLAQLGEELADTIIYADLVAHHYGIDLGAAIVAKFNAVSKACGFPERLSGPS